MPRRGSRCRRPPPLQSRTVPTRNRAAADRERQGAIGGPCPREVVQCLSLQRERRSLSGKRYLTGRVFARFASDTAHVRAVRTPQHSHESHRDRTRRVIGTQTRVRLRGSRGLSIYSGCGSSSHGRAHPGTRLARVRSPGTPNANRPARRRSASGLRESRNPRQHARTSPHMPRSLSVTARAGCDTSGYKTLFSIDWEPGRCKAQVQLEVVPLSLPCPRRRALALM